MITIDIGEEYDNDHVDKNRELIYHFTIFFLAKCLYFLPFYVNDINLLVLIFFSFLLFALFIIPAKTDSCIMLWSVIIFTLEIYLYASIVIFYHLPSNDGLKYFIGLQLLYILEILSFVIILYLIKEKPTKYLMFTIIFSVFAHLYCYKQIYDLFANKN